MGPAHMSDPEAIRAAARECDELGEEASLSKYGFASTQFVAMIDGKRYPGKVRACVAHGIELSLVVLEPLSWARDLHLFLCRDNESGGGLADPSRKLLQLGMLRHG